MAWKASKISSAGAMASIYRGSSVARSAYMSFVSKVCTILLPSIGYGLDDTRAPA